MSRDKLLWGLTGALAILAAVLGILLAQAKSPEQADPGTNTAEQPNEADPSQPETGQRVVARAGNATLSEEGFIDGLEKSFGDQYVRQWLGRTVVRLEAQALGINVTRSDIDEELDRMQVGYESEAEFYRVMKEQLGMSEQDLREDALHRLLLEAIATAHVSITDADVEQYIQEHPDEFAPRRDLRYAQIVTDSEEQVQKVLQQLGQGVDFGLLAKDLSLDGATASNGGDSGWISEDDPFIPANVVEALKDMEVGDISRPLELGDDRWIIVTLLGRRTIHPLDDSEVRKNLKRELALAQAPSLFDVEEALLKKYNAVDFLHSD